jgi:enolase
MGLARPRNGRGRGVVGRGATPLATGRAIAPAGASTGSGEAKAIDAASGGEHQHPHPRRPARAQVGDQAAIDARLLSLDGTPDKSHLGANAIVAVSLACAQADAAAEKKPLWKKLAGERRVALRCRRSRSSAAARMRTRASTSRTS